MRLSLLAVVLPLAACTGNYVEDYRTLYPVRVDVQPQALPVAFGGGAEPQPDQARMLDAFLVGYREQGRGPLVIVTNPTGAGDELAQARAETVARRAMALGISSGVLERRVRTSDNRPGQVIVSYDRVNVQVPECGDWSKNTADDWTNTPSVNFGCATQRAYGLMAADPLDLTRARAPGEHDAQRTSDVLQKYRSGRPQGAAPPVGVPAVGTGGFGQDK